MAREAATALASVRDLTIPAEAEPVAQQPAFEHDFDVDDLRIDKTFGARLKAKLLAEPEWFFALLRRFAPIAKPPGMPQILVSRYADVLEVLERDDVFGIPFGFKVEGLIGGSNFILGMDDGPDYRRLRDITMATYRREDIKDVVAALAAREAKAIVAAAPDRFDVVEHLFTRVAVRIVQDYFGVAIPDDRWSDFVDWNLAMSNYVFADPADDPSFRRAATAGAERVRAVVDASIDAERRAPAGRDTIVARLVMLQKQKPDLRLTDADLRAFLSGMFTGFLPTNTIAGANILKVLMNHPPFMAATRAAYDAGDEARLLRCLEEALRFKPVFWGPFRVAKSDYTLAAGTSREKKIKAGTRLSPLVQSAMRDERGVPDPHGFNPDRTPTDSMIFGHGLHWCVGAHIARAHLMGCYKALFALRDLRRIPGPEGERRTLGFIVRHQLIELVR
jgi:cytochrome P450